MAKRQHKRAEHDDDDDDDDEHGGVIPHPSVEQEAEPQATVGCGSCRFFIVNAGSETAGTCHRFPATIVTFGSNAAVKWVPVEPSDWCGEYQPLAE